MKVKIGRLCVLINLFMNLPEHENVELNEMPALFQELLEREVYVPFDVMRIFCCLL